MTDAIRELFELLAKKENNGSDYTGTITRVEGNTAYVRFTGSDITDTPVALSIGASEGDTVRVRVADGRAWLVGNDTAPPNDSSGVAYDLVRTNAYIQQLTTERIQGENGWINLLTGTFDYGAGALAWNGDHLTVRGSITATTGQIGPWNINSASIYKGSSTWGSSASGAAYFGDSGISITNKFKVDASGNATVSGTITAGAGSTIGPWAVSATAIYKTSATWGASGGRYFGDSGLSLSDAFKVTAAGALTCTGANITGDITASTGNIGGFHIINTSNNGTTSAGGHCYSTGMYAQASDSTYEYEVGMKGDSGSPNYLAFYVGRITKGAAWSTNTKVFSIANNGKLTATNADISGKVTATSGKIGPWSISTDGISSTSGSLVAHLYPNYLYFETSAKTCSLSGEIITFTNSSGYSNMEPKSVSVSATSGQADVNVHYVGGRSGRLVANANNFGLYDIGNTAWVLRSGNDGNTYITGKLYCIGTEDATGRQPVQSNTAAAGLVSVLSADSSALAVRGRWGSTTAFSTKNFTPAPSDIRIKTDINKSKIHALDLIRQIDICEFKKEGVYQPVGMIADWIEELDPLLTVGGGYDENGTMNIKSVDTFYLMGYVVKAIQELADKVSRVGG